MGSVGGKDLSWNTQPSQIREQTLRKEPAVVTVSSRPPGHSHFQRTESSTQSYTMARGHQAYLLLLALCPSLTETARVRCYTAMDYSTFTCTDLLGDNIEEKDCCLNPNYCFQRNADGKSILCRPASVWSEWSEWSRCSVTCTAGVQQRRRVCLGIRPCHRVESLQSQPCVEKPCCQRDGGWSAWSPWSPCSVTCHIGRQKRERSCSAPPPFCGGGCPGARESYRDCDTDQICPTHGSWSPWSPWGLCGESCKSEGSGMVPTRQRNRTCSNPPPSKYPAGRLCHGNAEDVGLCHFLPFCPVPGNWGSWVTTGPCPVSCGIAKVIYRRSCDKPAPRHGGAYCSGSDTTHGVCNTHVHCPDGKGFWTDWGDWGLCNPACGEGSVQSRRRICKPTYPPYADHRGEVEKVSVVFSGEPRYYCEQLDGQEREVVQTKPCHNVPACD
ncbi:properdin-like isoform X2 [Hypanus sabinus]|uniref:properdin-like isoform X2 n=1 Tax=Hypanus sabinus TaxID=79690 RepID=UPI0028C3C5B5|nr:properdin-like isoform X2 [Hypanus sabinus]